MTHFFLRLLPFFTGVAVSQILSTCLVYSANIRLYENMTALREAGWMTVPNSVVMETLKTFPPAFFGGLFFTLTIGIFITFVTLIVTKAKPEPGSSRWFYFWGPALCIWLGQLLLLNLSGINIWASLFILLIPPPVIWTALKFPAPQSERSKRLFAVHLICLVLLGLIGAYRLSPSVFSNIRDEVLLSNPVGMAVNDFYYRYTLYPAQAFKSLDQSQIRSVQISAELSPPQMRQLQQTLIRYDYLPLTSSVNSADVRISGQWEQLVFSVNGRTVHEAGGMQFIKSPKTMLKTVSRNADKWEPFRQLTFLSLCAVSMLTVYVLLFLPFRFIPGFFAKEKMQWFIMACGLAVGISLICFWHPRQAEISGPGDIADALESEFPQERIAALKSITLGKGRVGEFAERISLSDSAVERYWLVKALAKDRKTAAYPILIRLMDDPQINVAYRAVNALGLRKQRKAVPEIIRHIDTSTHWYFQLYAYKTLRRLGWKQTASH